MARSISEQTGWRRRHPEQICQDVQALSLVCEVDFDLRDASFRDYLRRRGVCDIDRADDPVGLIAFYQDWTEERVYRDSEPLRAEAPALSPREREAWVRIWKRARARFQDAWELFKGVDGGHEDSAPRGQLDLFAA